ncbi:MAG: RagB/SusD family nutrient uptake outer membrane protein [Saprospiraceae bacterium]|nr:RagB/SusD family nutrient uptake outer membrane protein [Saprospiraceae bacterium]
MKLNNIKFLAILLILFVSSCTKELDVTPGDPNAFLSEDFYSSPESYRQGLAGVYSNLTLTGVSGPGSSNIAGIDAGTSQYGRGLWNLQVLAADEAKWSWENDPGVAEIQRSTWVANNVLLRGMYGRGMAQVAFANEFLRQTTDELLSKRGVSTELRAEIATYRAEARFLRALAYYHMMDLFGKCAFVTDENPVGAYQAPQAERPQLFKYIESELLDIEDDLKAPRQNEYARADRGAAWMLLAKLYLNAQVFVNENRYADCIAYCDKIISAGYQLAPNYLNLFKADNNNNDATIEIIFPVLSDGVVTQNYGPTTLMINSQVGSKESNGASFGVNAGGWGGALRVPKQFSEIFLNGEYDRDDRNTLITADRTIDISSIADRSTGYIIGKWSNLTSTGARGKALEIVDTDFPMFRLADVYLMYVEATLKGGGGARGKALEYFNALRTRAKNPNLISDAELTLDLLIDERLVELHWESHRRQDLIRFDMFTGNKYNWSWKGNAANGIAIPDYRKVYPLPSESLAANPNLTQNPGY